MPEEDSKLAILAMALAVALLGVLGLEVIMLPKAVDAAGCPVESPAANASRSRCIHFR